MKRFAKLSIIALVLMFASTIGTESANAGVLTGNCTSWFPAVGLSGGVMPVIGVGRYCSFYGWEYIWW